jgi:hypothetical protein
MFFCEMCRFARRWPGSLMRSHGPCEICGVTSNCYDVPSKELPLRGARSAVILDEKVRQQLEAVAAARSEALAIRQAKAAQRARKISDDDDE